MVAPHYAAASIRAAWRAARPFIPLVVPWWPPLGRSQVDAAAQIWVTALTSPTRGAIRHEIADCWPALAPGRDAVDAIAHVATAWRCRQ